MRGCMSKGPVAHPRTADANTPPEPGPEPDPADRPATYGHAGRGAASIIPHLDPQKQAKVPAGDSEPAPRQG